MRDPNAQERSNFPGEPDFRFVPHWRIVAPPPTHDPGGPAEKHHSNAVTRLTRRAGRVALLALAAGLCCGMPLSSLQASLRNKDPMARYRHVKSYVDRRTSDLIAHLPDLKGLQPVANPEEGEKGLETILDRVGENVRQFFAQFPDVTSLEQITLKRLGPHGRIVARRDETFRYLAVAGDNAGTSTLLEYRTDLKGNPIQPTGLAQGFVITKGFASLPIYLHPALRPGAFFRYLGREQMGGKETDVVAFAQRPGRAEFPIHVHVSGRTARVLVQGLAWINSSNSQIVRMRIDLLVPRPDVGPVADTTIITLGEVHFPEMPRKILWLPREVTVTLKWEQRARYETKYFLPGTTFTRTETEFRKERVTYRNIHRYSGYRLFAARSKLKF